MQVKSPLYPRSLRGKHKKWVTWARLETCLGIELWLCTHRKGRLYGVLDA